MIAMMMNMLIMIIETEMSASACFLSAAATALSSLTLFHFEKTAKTLSL